MGNNKQRVGPVAGPVLASASAALSNQPTAGLQFGRIQRRRLSVMFVDLVDSTRFAASHDLDETRDLLLAFLETATTRIQGAKGYVARYMGDGLLAYFGYPVSQEEAAISAVSAALAAHSAIGQILLPDGTALQARIGIATGEVTIGDIVGRGLAAECMVIGAAANLGARLQAAAAPGQVLVCETTMGLCGDAFAASPTAPLQLKGLADEVIAWRIDKARKLDRFASRRTLGLAPLIGRELELSDLQAVLGELEHGLQRVLIGGPAGIGKSRLLHALHADPALPGLRWLRGSGVASASDTPFYGFAQLLSSLVGTAAGHSPERRFERLCGIVQELGQGEDCAARLAEAAGWPSTLMVMPPSTDADIRRSQLRDDCAALLRRACAHGPIVVAIEDAHWLDPSTTALLEAIASEVADLPVLLLATSRDLGAGPWRDARSIVLGELGQAALLALASHAAGGNLPEAAVARIAKRANGVPLYAEELARFLAFADAADDLAIPERLSDLLLCRLDRGANALAVAQAIALLGEDAFPATIAEISGLDRASVERALDRFAAEDVVTRANSDEVPLAFRHALFADVAYGSMPRRLRTNSHLGVARLLEQRGSPPDRIARQFEQAQKQDRAAHWWRTAGVQARSRGAMPEAAGAFARAIALTAEPAIDDTNGQAAQLELHEAHFEVVQISSGYSAAPTVAAGARLRELVEQQGDLEQQMVAVTGQWAAASSAGHYDLANRHAARAPAIARALGTPDVLAVAAMIQLTARYRVGDMAGAEAAWHSGLPHFADPLFASRPGALAQTFGNGAIVAWLRGQDADTAERLRRLRSASGVLPDPYNQTFIHHMTGIIELLRDQPEAALEAGQVSLETAQTAGFQHYLAISRIVIGAAKTRLADRTAGLAQLREAIDQMVQSPSRSGITLYHCWLAEAELASGEPDMALGSVNRALRLCPEERYFIPELHRLQAIAEARLGRPDRFAPLLRNAAAQARRFEAPGLFRRIAATLAAGEFGTA